MPARQRRLDAFLLPNQPVERFVQRLLVNRAEFQHCAERAARRLTIERLESSRLATVKLPNQNTWVQN